MRTHMISSRAATRPSVIRPWFPSLARFPHHLVIISAGGTVRLCDRKRLWPTSVSPSNPFSPLHRRAFVHRDRWSNEHTRTSGQRRSFAAYRPVVWNTLPTLIGNVQLNCFRARLKTFQSLAHSLSTWSAGLLVAVLGCIGARQHRVFALSWAEGI